MTRTDTRTDVRTIAPDELAAARSPDGLSGQLRQAGHPVPGKAGTAEQAAQTRWPSSVGAHTIRSPDKGTEDGLGHQAGQIDWSQGGQGRKNAIIRQLEQSSQKPGQRSESAGRAEAPPERTAWAVWLMRAASRCCTAVGREQKSSKAGALKAESSRGKAATNMELQAAQATAAQTETPCWQAGAGYKCRMQGTAHKVQPGAGAPERVDLSNAQA